MLAELTALAGQSAARALRGYIVVSGRDRWSYERSVVLAASLRDAGAACEVEMHPTLGHAFPPHFASSLARGLSFLHGDSEPKSR